MDNFNQLIETLLNSIQEHPEMSTDEVILDAASKMGCDDAQVREILCLLDRMNEEALSLEKSHEDGLTRTDWITDKMENLEKNVGDTASILLEGIEKGIDEGLTNL